MQNQIPKNWQKDNLENLLDILIDHRGITPKKLDGEWSVNGIPAISAKNIKTGKIVNEEDIRFVSQKLYERWMPEKLESGDILLTSEAPLGDLYFLKEKKDYVLSQRLFAIRTNRKKLDSRYLYYYLQGSIGRQELLRRLSGTAAEGIRQAELRKITVEFPEDILEQKKIASMISAFDDKIEVNNKIAKTLEEMAQALFKEWFVHFRFPGYEKAEFVDSELGKIPKGWEVKRLREITKIKKGVSYSSPEINEKSIGLPMINLANFQRGGGFNPDGIKFYTGRYNSTNLVKLGDIVIAMTDLTSNREVIGHPARVPSYAHWDKILISLDVCSIDVDDLLVEFLYYLMLRRDFSYQMASSAGGTNVAHLSKSTIEEYIFVLPERVLIEKFQDFVKPIFNKTSGLELENQKLAALRDLLLPKLMKGEIRA